jgi:hypothetical protein
MESIEEIVGKIGVFSLRDKQDVLRAHEALSKFRIKVFKTDEDLRKFELKDSDIKDNFLMKDSDGWRIQSHFIGKGFPVEELVILSESYVKKIGSSRNKMRELGKEIIRMIERGDLIDSSVYSEYNKNVMDIKKSNVE